MARKGEEGKRPRPGKSPAPASGARVERRSKSKKRGGGATPRVEKGGEGTGGSGGRLH